ncbi:protein N-terminal methyltransferase, partial [Paragonimus westermani]
ASASIAPVQKASSQGHSNASKLGLKNSSPKTKHEKQKLLSAVSKRLTATKQPPPPLVISPAEPPPNFYSNAKTYWSQVSPTVDGMLGGYSSLNVPDIEDSHLFLDEFGPATTAYALDCGSGIGRVTKQLLIPRFNFVDMVEMTQSFLDQTKDYIGEEDFDSIGERFCSGLQDFTPPVGRYDLIWIQWVLGHLTDVALIGFLQRCARALSVDGVIVVKENITSGNPDDQLAEAKFDELDSSFTRSRKAFLDLFEKSDLTVSGEKLQTNFPSSIYPVRMFALRPRKINISPTAPDTNSAIPT